jgi:hypothetical protein
MQVWIGYDQRDDLAARVCIASLRRHASRPLAVHLLKDHELRRRGLYNRPYRVMENGQMIDARDLRPFSTQFAFTRFIVPYLTDAPLALYCDADFMFRTDVAQLFDEAQRASSSYPLMCVHHAYVPSEPTKMDGVLQAAYFRKNWSSLMVMRPAVIREHLSLEDINHRDGRWLHGMTWLGDGQIGALDENWNWLEGWSKGETPKAVHFTRGTPDMIDNCNEVYAREWRAYAEQV